MAFDVEIAAATVFLEASGEIAEGRRAVAWVILNRLKAGGYGNSLAAICLKPFAFSGWNTADPNRLRMAETPDDDPVLNDCEAAVNEVLAGGTDPTNGALNYYAATMSEPPAWAATMEFTAQIGNHRFYKPATT